MVGVAEVEGIGPAYAENLAQKMAGWVEEAKTLPRVMTYQTASGVPEPGGLLPAAKSVPVASIS